MNSQQEREIKEQLMRTTPDGNQRTDRVEPAIALGEANFGN